MDAKSVVTLDSTVSTKEGDTDGFYAFFVHTEPTLDYLARVSEHEIFERDLMIRG